MAILGMTYRRGAGALEFLCGSEPCLRPPKEPSCCDPRPREAVTIITETLISKVQPRREDGTVHLGSLALECLLCAREGLRNSAAARPALPPLGRSHEGEASSEREHRTQAPNASSERKHGEPSLLDEREITPLPPPGTTSQNTPGRTNFR